VVGLRWRWHRWHVRHLVWQADLEYRRHPTPANAHELDRAVILLRRTETARP
jgi:hypothetical protein